MDHVRCGEGLTESSVPGLEVVVRGESGRNELLRGPFALFGVRNSAKLVRDLAKHRRTPMSPSAIDSAYFPGADFCQGRKTHIHTPPPRPLAVPAASSPA